ncbi:MAG: hypothetical protein ACTH31_12255, partial [Pseudoclavibacter sp.]
PLSRKRAMLLALLIDAEVDRGATAPARGDAADEGARGGAPAGGSIGLVDALGHRRAVADAEPALAAVMQVAAMSDGGPRLVTETVELKAADEPALSQADYMVSRYNAGTVQRVRVAWPDGRRLDALDVFRVAVASLGA